MLFPLVPQPYENRPEGFEYNQTTNGAVGQIKTDLELYGKSRTEDKPYKATNMTQAASKLFWGSNNTLKIEGKPNVRVIGTPWEDVMKSLMGDAMLTRFRESGYGFMDRDDEKLELILCGRNWIHVVMEGIQGDQKFLLFECQDFDKEPDPDLTPKSNPLLFTKQQLVSSSARRKYQESVSRGVNSSTGELGSGDVWFPTVDTNRVPDFSDIPLAAIEEEKVTIYTRPPFNTKIYADNLIGEEGKIINTDGLFAYPVTIESLIYTESSIYALIGTYKNPILEILSFFDWLRPILHKQWKPDYNWYLIDTMKEIGYPSEPMLGGTMDERELHAYPLDGVGGVCSIGWTWKYKPEGFDWY